MGKKHDESGICVRLQGYSLVGVTETWWDVSHDWSVVMEEYRPFRKDRMRKGGGGLALYMREQLEYMELCLRADEEPTEHLRVRIKERTGKDDIIVGVCCRPPDREEQVDEALDRQMGAASCSQALVLMRDFNQPDIGWRDNTAGHKQSRRFLECIEDNFLTLVIEKPVRKGTLLDLLTLTNEKDLVENVKAGSSFGCTDQ